MDVVLKAGAGERAGGGDAPLPLVCLGLAIRADSQVPAPTDDPRLSLADAQLAPTAPQAGRGGGDDRAAATWSSR